MWKSILILSGLLLILSLSPAGAHTPAADGCGASASEYANELQVMTSTASSIGAPASASPVLLELGRRYAISLDDQHKLKFRRQPGRASRAQNLRGGLFSFRTGEAGLYRVSLTSRHWIDLIDGDSVVESRRHFGPGCALIHKIVEFELPGDRQIYLQLSGREDATIGLAITAASPGLAKSEASAEPVARR